VGVQTLVLENSSLDTRIMTVVQQLMIELFYRYTAMFLPS
jgi:hypothetical protein